jgi:uncharacterized membrane protein
MSDREGHGTEVKGGRVDDEPRLLAALAYANILFLAPLFLARKSEFAKFHVRQGIVLFAFDAVASVFVWFPIIGPVLMAAAVILSVIGFFQAIAGNRWELPWLGKYAKDIRL